MNNQRTLFRLATQVVKATRNASTNTTANYKDMKAFQDKLGLDNGIPVHLKSGFGDRGLYLATWGLCTIGVLGGIQSTFVMIFK